MAQYLSPGVYVEDTEPLSRPISGVGTSTAGFIGVSSVGSVDTPEIITSWGSFVGKFGDISENNKILALAVFGFFHNGGNRCWVVKVDELDETSLTKPLEKFAAIDEIAIVAAPGATTVTQQSQLLEHCMSLQDRVAILDGIQSPASFASGEINSTGRSEKGSFGAVYFPWIKVFDPVSKGMLATPPSGHIAGVYARNDAKRGVYKAPANEIILGAVGLEHRLSKADQDGLNPDGVNVIREFNGAIKIWGGRTLADKDNVEFRYISTRRYMNFLRESIEEGTQWVVFEPNTPSLWQRITRTLNDFLTNQWREGALFGETAKQAFFVRCDANTNPQSEREAGRVITEIGVAIVKPAEFVIFRIQQTTGG